MGLGRFHDPRPEALPDDGTHYGDDPQLVDDLYATGHSGKHSEAITSRPLALHGIARRTRHSNQTTVEVTSTHAKASMIAEVLSKVSGFLKRVRATAEQLTQVEQWKLILSAAFRSFLGGKVIGSTGRLADAAV